VKVLVDCNGKLKVKRLVREILPAVFVHKLVEEKTFVSENHRLSSKHSDDANREVDLILLVLTNLTEDENLRVVRNAEVLLKRDVKLNDLVLVKVREQLKKELVAKVGVFSKNRDLLCLREAVKFLVADIDLVNVKIPAVLVKKVVSEKSALPEKRIVGGVPESESLKIRDLGNKEDLLMRVVLENRFVLDHKFVSLKLNVAELFSV
jgi:hypothetical protein